MKTFTCPHCHKDSISIWQKACIGVRSMSSCDECGARLSTPVLWGLLSVSPIFGLILVDWLSVDLRNNPWLDVGVIGLVIVLQLFVVPVVAKPTHIAGRQT